MFFLQYGILYILVIRIEMSIELLHMSTQAPMTLISGISTQGLTM